ncbi:MAG: SET domain-containing protein-lysine N-methyltransferase [Candidatus Vogelbacteria bacterium]|nr:SET domain-containing protein-lysine N-methyltransferase [Candidatus Vogelbacteria bacterium]
MKLPTSDRIYLSRSKIKGANRGVFAHSKIKKGEIIEKCPVVIIPAVELPDINKTTLLNYYFCFAKDESKWAIALGFGSLYNHSYEPNATYTKDYKNSLIYFTAIKDVLKDEEITVNYNSGDPEDKTQPYNFGVPPYKELKRSK